jgi:carbon storage regulator
MLVLSRKPTERIQIGERIVITVLDIGRNRVRIGIDAPRDVPVRRTELPGNDFESPREGTRPAIMQPGRPIALNDARAIASWETEGGAAV